jgi:hypothetical protein
MDVYLRPARRSQRHTGESSKKLALHFAYGYPKYPKTERKDQGSGVLPELSRFRTWCLSLPASHYCIVDILQYITVA